MALLEIRPTGGDSQLGLWHITETEEEMFSLFPHLRHQDIPYKNEARRMEFLAIRALLTTMTGSTFHCIGHLPNGKPTLSGFHISISHTKGYAALMLSERQPLAVDIEQRSDRVQRIASHFIRSDEEATTVEQMLILWSAKETLYKLHSEDNLHYFEMRLTQWHPDHLLIENMKRGLLVDIHHEQTAHYVLTHVL